MIALWTGVWEDPRLEPGTQRRIPFRKGLSAGESAPLSKARDFIRPRARPSWLVGCSLCNRDLPRVRFPAALALPPRHRPVAPCTVGLVRCLSDTMASSFGGPDHTIRTPLSTPDTRRAGGPPPSPLGPPVPPPTLSASAQAPAGQRADGRHAPVGQGKRRREEVDADDDGAPTGSKKVK